METEKETPTTSKSEIVRIYQTLGKYYTDIGRDFSKLLFNWIFALNTGGFALTISYIGATQPNTNSKCLFISTCIIFALGIIFAFLGAIFERLRFSKKGALLDHKFDDYQNNIKDLSEREFLTAIQNTTPYYDKFVPFLEYSSIVIFFVGLGISLHTLIS